MSRNPDCLKYYVCLDRAARFRKAFHCEKCPDIQLPTEDGFKKYVEEIQGDALTTLTIKKEIEPMDKKLMTKPVKPVSQRVKPLLTVDFRSRPDVLERLEQLATEEERSLSSQIVYICKRFLER